MTSSTECPEDYISWSKGLPPLLIMTCAIIMIIVSPFVDLGLAIILIICSIPLLIFGVLRAYEVSK